jgi:hypothetical protein
MNVERELTMALVERCGEGGIYIYPSVPTTPSRFGILVKMLLRVNANL